MTDQEMRIAIADACGWKKCKTKDALQWQHPQMTGPSFNQSELPNYPNDLNAMHEAEKILTEKQREQYLDSILAPDDEAIPYEELWLFLHATARQRAEAFLRTLDKWKD